MKSDAFHLRKMHLTAPVVVNKKIPIYNCLNLKFCIVSVKGLNRYRKVIVMGIFLLICFIVFELALMISSFSRFSEKKQCLVARCIFWAGELVVFLFVMLFPNVTFDFKYQLCFALLLIRLAGALVMYLIMRMTATGKRSRVGAVFGAVGSIVILSLKHI